MRRVLLLLFACGGDPNPHDVTTCKGAWTANDPASCEIACEYKPANAGDAGATGDACIAHNPTEGVGVQTGCTWTFYYKDLRGCCIRDAGDEVMRFWQCE